MTTAVDWIRLLIGGATAVGVTTSFSAEIPRLVVPEGVGGLRRLPAGTLATQATIAPMLQAGHPAPDPRSGILPDSPESRIDANVASSRFSGIGSIFVAPDPNNPLGFLGTATPIARDLILTAAHCVDVLNADGVPDARPEDILFILNYSSDFSSVIPAKQVAVHPDYRGFSTSTLNDDLAVIRLSQPLPADVPIYPFAKPEWLNVAPLIMAGYGESGDGIQGYTIPPSFSEKRTGANLLEAVEGDDEGGPEPEVALWDFEYEGDPDRYDVLGIPLAFPNPIETTLGAGDSGGPSFLLNPDDPSDPTLYLAVVNTFSFWFPKVEDHDTPGKFGSGGGGMWLNQSYQSWIAGVPDTSSWLTESALSAVALGLMRRRQR